MAIPQGERTSMGKQKQIVEYAILEGRKKITLKVILE